MNTLKQPAQRKALPMEIWSLLCNDELATGEFVLGEGEEYGGFLAYVSEAEARQAAEFYTSDGIPCEPVKLFPRPGKQMELLP